MYYEKRIFEILNDRVGNEPCDFFVGEYGGFDNFAYDCAKKFIKNHVRDKVIFITPYPVLTREKSDLQYQKRFDSILYPGIETVPRRYAILCRNRWIVEHSDILIAYVTHKYGGAYTMYQYAKRKNKEIYNIAKRGDIE